MNSSLVKTHNQNLFGMKAQNSFQNLKQTNLGKFKTTVFDADIEERSGSSNQFKKGNCNARTLLLEHFVSCLRESSLICTKFI